MTTAATQQQQQRQQWQHAAKMAASAQLKPSGVPAALPHIRLAANGCTGPSDTSSPGCIVRTPLHKPAILPRVGSEPQLPSAGGSSWDALLMAADACRANDTSTVQQQQQQQMQQQQQKLAALCRLAPAAAGLQSALQPQATSAWQQADVQLNMAVAGQQAAVQLNTATPWQRAASTRRPSGFSVHQAPPAAFGAPAAAGLKRPREALQAPLAAGCSSALRRKVVGGPGAEVAESPCVHTPTAAAAAVLAAPRRATAAALHGASSRELSGDAWLVQALSSALLAPLLPRLAPRRAQLSGGGGDGSASEEDGASAASSARTAARCVWLCGILCYAGWPPQP